MNFSVNPKKALYWLLKIIGFLFLIHVFGIILKLQFDSSILRGLVALFDFDKEANIPSFYSGVTLLFSGSLLYVISLTHKKNNSSYFPWLLLAYIFLFLSIDEVASLHEGIIGKISKALIIKADAAHLLEGNAFYFWLLPYGFGLLIFAIFYIKFLFRLPRNIMYLFLSSGAIFISGAMGFELIGGSHYSRNDLIYSVYTTCEESLEMIGIAIFIYSLLIYIESNVKSISINVTNE